MTRTAARRTSHAIALLAPVAALLAPGVSSLSQAAMAAPPASSNSQIYEVAVAPKSADAWAVARNSRPTGAANAILHRHGNHWSAAKVKGVPAATLLLYGVAAGSPRRAWVVGDNDASGASRQLLATSTGGSFTPVKLRALGAGQLLSVAASAPNNAWVIGNSGVPATGDLALHWNGKSWKSVSLHIPAAVGPIYNATVTTASSHSAWLLASGSSAVIEHWNGHKWSAAPPIAATEAITAISEAGGVTWAIGESETTTTTAAIALRLAGKTWKPVTLPAAAAADTFQSVAAVGSSAYVVGRSATNGANGDTKAIALRLRGTSGKLRKVSASGKNSDLAAVAASSKAVLAVGAYEKVGYCASPFHALAVRLVHSAFKSAKLPSKLVPASKTGTATCGG